MSIRRTPTMTLGSRTILGGLGTLSGCLVGVMLWGSPTSGQAPATPPAGTPRPPMAEEVFKNIQVLKGIPVDEFMGTMGVFSAALGMSCEDCHPGDDRSWENYAKDIHPRKMMARRMVTMMAAINKENFAGLQNVTCVTCHRGAAKPPVTPSLALLYGEPLPEEPFDIFPQAMGAPTPDQVLDKYLQAIGGVTRAAALTSYVAKGTSLGYGPEGERPIEIYAKAPDQRTTIIHTQNGDLTMTYDGKSGWVSAPLRPVDVVTLTRHELDSARLEAALAFPVSIKKSLILWRVGTNTTIDGRKVVQIQGNSPRGALATLYFDAESGLLVRLVRYASSAVGRLPTQTDYSDYRDVAGVKVPHAFTLTWLGGREQVTLTEIRPNVAIDAARFAQPGPPVAPAPAQQ
jgi:hypothetical protein